MINTRRLTSLAACLIAASGPGLVGAAPVKTRVVTGAEAGPAVRVIVGRTEREKAYGLDDQLAAFTLTKGSLIVETHELNKAIEPGLLAEGTTLAWDIVVSWPTPAADASKPGQEPIVTSTAPAKAMTLLRSAIGDSFDEETMTRVAVGPLSGGETATPGRIVMELPKPQSGISKARQYRYTRRLAAGLLVDLDMMDPYPGAWPPAFPAEPTLSLYDAQGVGYSGSTLLERVVNESTIPVRVVPVCGEDVRDGALDRSVGILIPGGSGKGVATAMRPEGVENVREFVARGGGYFGVCAGAYFAASGLPEYTGMMNLKHNQPWAKGKANLDIALTEEGKALLGEEFAQFDTNYNNGPVFPEILPPQEGAPHAPITVLATFASAATDTKGVTHEGMVGTPAIASTTWGNGRVMMISPHPEARRKYNAMVARAMAWTLGMDTATIMARITPEAEAAAKGAEPPPPADEPGG